MMMVHVYGAATGGQRVDPGLLREQPALTQGGPRAGGGQVCQKIAASDAGARRVTLLDVTFHIERQSCDRLAMQIDHLSVSALLACRMARDVSGLLGECDGRVRAMRHHIDIMRFE